MVLKGVCRAGIKKRGLKAGARKELMQAAKEKAQQLSSKIGG